MENKFEYIMKKSVAQCLFLIYMQRAGMTTITITNKAYRGRTGEVHNN